ncbi:MAG: endo alpha-1,4 polygalactosaminidase [Polyangiaceae bacterium]|nr:endo alpha-1,4 polygalactosaminidase [Polyangiaceae bacterium]
MSCVGPRALALVLIVACGDSADGSGASSSSGGAGGAGEGRLERARPAPGWTPAGGAAAGGAGEGGALPAYATFHLNYTQDKDWSKCAERATSSSSICSTRPRPTSPRARTWAHQMLCYFSSQYEEWRDDADSFGALGEMLDGWPGEYWVDPTDPRTSR